MTVALVTPTGDRQEAFSLCERWILGQTYSDFQWLIVDDGQEETRLRGDTRQYVYRWPLEGRWRPGVNTQLRNLEFLLVLVQDIKDHMGITHVAFIEDDEWYSPGWLGWMLENMEGGKLVGEGQAVYYAVKTGTWKRHENREHACLCRTVMSVDLIEATIGLVRELRETGGEILDLELWKRYGSEGRVLCKKRPKSIGFKGMPGRGGVMTRAHKGYKVGMKGYKKDIGGLKLVEWLGVDMEAYLPYVGRKG